MEGESSSIMVSLMLETLRLSRSNFLEFRSASGVEGALGAAAKRGVVEGERALARAAWWQVACGRSRSLRYRPPWCGGRGPEILGRTSRMRRRVEGRHWVSREVGVEGNGGDTIHCIEGKGGLCPKSPAAKKLGHRIIH